MPVNISEYLRISVAMGLTKAELDTLKARIGDLPDVTSGPHRFGGVEFKAHGLEFMHFHGQTHLDIRLAKPDQARVLAEGKAERHLFAPEAGWVTFIVKSSEDIDKAMEIARLAHNYALSIVNQHQTNKPVQK